MPVSFTLPLLEQKPSSTRDLVFSILSQHHPLSVAELRAEMRKKYSKAVSFQAVHKAVLQLLNEGVLSQEGKKLTLNRQWVLDLVRFSNQLHKSYFAHTPSAERMVVGSNVMVYTVDSLADMDLVWNSIIVDNFKKNPTQPRVIACEALHFWFVLVNLGAETELTKDVLHNDIDIYYLNYGGTNLTNGLSVIMWILAYGAKCCPSLQNSITPWSLEHSGILLFKPGIVHRSRSASILSSENIEPYRKQNYLSSSKLLRLRCPFSLPSSRMRI